MRQAQARAKGKNNIIIGSLLNLLEIYTLWILFIYHFCCPMGVNSCLFMKMGSSICLHEPWTSQRPFNIAACFSWARVKLVKGHSYEIIFRLRTLSTFWSTKHFFGLLKIPTDLPNVHLVYEPTRVKPNDGAYLLQGLLRMDFIQLPKFSALNPAENQLLSAWVQLFGAKSAEDLEIAASETPALSNLVRSLKDMSSNPELIDLAEKRRIEKIIDRRARLGELEDAKEEARKTGLAEGRQEGQTQATLAAVQKISSKGSNYPLSRYPLN